MSGSQFTREDIICIFTAEKLFTNITPQEWPQECSPFPSGTYISVVKSIHFLWRRFLLPKDNCFTYLDKGYYYFTAWEYHSEFYVYYPELINPEKYSYRINSIRIDTYGDILKVCEEFRRTESLFGITQLLNHGLSSSDIQTISQI